MTFRLTQKQNQALQVMGSDAVHILLYGGSRSSKSFTVIRTMIIRAVWCPNSRHLIARFRLSHVKASVVADTLPKVLELCFPELLPSWNRHSKSENHWVLPNGSEIWWAGLDDKDRTEKILGMEFATIDLEEASQIPWASREVLVTRLAQKTSRPNPDDPDGKKGLPRLPGLRLKAYATANPPLKSHWTYKLFIEKVAPDTGRRLPNPENFSALLMNPMDNQANIAEGYIDELKGLSERKRKRFLEGQFGDAGEAALWSVELIEQQRISEYEEIDIGQFTRIVVGVDPSGASGIDDAHRDEIGIIVAGLRNDGVVVVLEDVTMKGSPGDWGDAVVAAFHRWGADRVVAEMNFGGDMVRFTVQTAAAKAKLTVPFRPVIASRGKVVRAEPIAALYEAQKVEHVPGLQLLEDQMCQMTTFGYTGDKSPDRVDACLVGGSVITTMRGDVAIRDVVVGDMVMTRKGYRRVLESRMTKLGAQTFDVLMSDGKRIQGTAEHPVFVSGKGFVPIDALVCGDIIEPIERWLTCPTNTRCSLNLMGWFTRDIPMQKLRLGDITTSAIMTRIIANFGKSITGRFLPTCTSTTLMRTLSTIPSTTSKLLRQSIMPMRMQAQKNRSDRGITSIPSGIWPLLGTAVQKALNGIGSMAQILGQISPYAKREFAKAAAKLSSPAILLTQGFVLNDAAGDFLIGSSGTSIRSNAQSAGPFFGKANIGSFPQHAPVHVVRKCAAEIADVFNLEVEGEHEFFANGVLVHNCVWAITDLFPAAIKIATNETRASRIAPPRVNLGHQQAKRASNRR